MHQEAGRGAAPAAPAGIFPAPRVPSSPPHACTRQQPRRLSHRKADSPHGKVGWLVGVAHPMQAAATGQSAVKCGWSEPMMEHPPPALLHFPGSCPSIVSIRHRSDAPASRRERRGWKNKGVNGGLRRGRWRVSVVEAVRIAGDHRHRTPRGRGTERVSPQLNCLGKKVLETARSCPSLRRHPSPGAGPRSFTQNANLASVQYSHTKKGDVFPTFEQN